MLAHAAGAGAAPMAGLTAGILLLLCAWVALQGIRIGYDNTIGALLRELAEATRSIRWIGGRIADTFERLDSRILYWIGEGIDGVETAVSGLWSALAWIVRETGDALTAFGRDVYGALEGIVDGEIPQQISGWVKPLRDDLAAFRRAVRHTLDEEMARFLRGIDSLRRDLTADRLRSMRGIDAVRDALRTQLKALEGRMDARVGQAVGALRRPFSLRLSRLEAALGAGIIGAISIAALSRVFPWWQCTNVRRFMRLLCRAPLGALDDLLGLAFVVVGSLSIVELAKALQPVTEFTADATHDWLTDD